MSLIQMSVLGGVLILAVIVLRALTLNHLPKGTFLALWAIAVLRLLVPFSISSPASVYTLVERVQVMWETLAAEPSDFVAGISPSVPAPAPEGETNSRPAAVPEAVRPVWTVVWLAGMLVCGMFFLISYLRCLREFRTALPVADQWLQAWLASQQPRRKISLRQSDRMDAPLTYGLLHPVILLPKGWEDIPQLAYVLEHELIHTQRLDALWKLVLAFTACVHWFNPLVWCMFTLANRDLELRCDEDVVRRFGLDRRGAYALALISMEGKKSGLEPFASAFSKNAIEERIRAIMKIKKRSLTIIIAAALLVCCVATGFATSAATKKAAENQTAFAGPDTDNVAYIQKQAQSVMGVVDAMDELLPELTEEEKLWIANQYISGYSDLTITDYRQKVLMKWDHSGTETWDALNLYRDLRSGSTHLPDALSDFDDYFFHIYLPLINDNWQAGCEFSGASADGSAFTYTLTVLDPDALTVGEYDSIRREAETTLSNPMKDVSNAAGVNELSTQALRVDLGI